MKANHLFFTCLFALLTISLPAQTVDEIIDTYYENTGGAENWENLKGVKFNAKVNQGGLEIPVEIVRLKDGRQMTKITFQGNVIKQGVFDGETLWNTNFQTMKAEKADAEITAVQKLEANDFPESLFNYKDKGYAVELVGKDTIEGAETFKVKLTKEPVTIEGEEVEDVVYFYFDTEAFVPLAQESTVKMGPQKGVIQQVKFSDYQEVEGLYFPFSLTQGIKDGPSQPIQIESIELNPEVDDSEFAFPDGE